MIAKQNENINPAECLVGLELKGGYIVEEKKVHKPNMTGGHFSRGYIVSKGSQKYFLKAIDLSSAFQSSDPLRTIQDLTTSFNFERDLLNKCSKAKMKKIMCPVADGYVDVPGVFGPYGRVNYLIFELANGDIRSVRNEMVKFDLAWMLRSMHHASTGLKELHQANVVHQDLKPSNLMEFKSKSFKICDLGRAFDLATAIDHDLHQVPGDKAYAPPEAFYGFSISDINTRKLYDLYALGGLIFFHILGMSPTMLLMNILNKNKVVTTQSWDQDLPFFKNAFTESIIELEKAIKDFPAYIKQDLIVTARELCNPDFTHRGHPKNYENKYDDILSVERYISRFNVIASKAEWELKK